MTYVVISIQRDQYINKYYELVNPSTQGGSIENVVHITDKGHITILPFCSIVVTQYHKVKWKN